MLGRTKKLAILFGLIELFATFGFLLKPAAALPLSTSCGSNLINYTALYPLEADTYDVYVRLGKRDQTAKAALYLQPLDSESCQKLVDSKVNGKKWTRAGTIENTQPTQATLTLASSEFEDLPSANSPTVMLVPRSAPVCQPTTECFVNINGKRGVVHATGTKLGQDSLHVVVPKNPANDKLLSVDYYIDNKLAYSLSEIKPFNMRYVGGGEHTLATVATYDSQQQIVFSEQIKQNAYDDLDNLLFSGWHKYKPVFIIGISLLFIYAVFTLCLYVARKVYQKRLWEKLHDVSIKTLDATAPDQSQITTIKLKFLAINPDLRKVAKRSAIFIAILASSVVLIIVANNWVLQLYEVDGPSMKSTLQNGDGIVVNKFGKAWQGILGKPYIPKRGEVVVFSRAQDVLYEPVESSAPTYLVKRVVGLPGERVVVKEGKVTVYNDANKNGFNPDDSKDWTKDLHLSQYDRIDLTVGPDEIFVCGDNREESIDSRSFGPIKINQVVGDVAFRLSPLSHIRIL